MDVKTFLLSDEFERIVLMYVLAPCVIIGMLCFAIGMFLAADLLAYYVVFH